MELSYRGLKDSAAWKQAGIGLPDYDPKALACATVKDPRWVHVGIGNIFRIFIGGIADTLIAEHLLDRGITCVEAFDYDVVDKIYAPFDNLVLSATLSADGSRDFRVLGSLSEAVKARMEGSQSLNRLKEIFTNRSLQLVTFTITEKGYALKSPDGSYLPYVKSDIEKGPSKATGVMGIMTALLYERFLKGAVPLAMVSFDNVSKNGSKLRDSVLKMAEVWLERGFVSEEFLSYVSDESRVSFPWTMIDKITPRPSPEVALSLEEKGVEKQDIVVTSRHTYIAPFVNAEKPQYLVVEDSFPNGRPPLEKAGVFLTDRETVNLSERMKVTVCLNPVHTALCTYAVMLGYKYFSDGFLDEDLHKLAYRLAYVEGLPVVDDPKIISPKAFLDELFNERFPNSYMGDTNARIAVDISQMLGIRFGHTVKAYLDRYGSTETLTAEPLAIAGWLRYLLSVDDFGRSFELSPDPMAVSIRSQLSQVSWDRPDTLGDSLKGILSNAELFGLDLYSAGLGDRIEQMVREMLEGSGAVRQTLKKYLGRA